MPGTTQTPSTDMVPDCEKEFVFEVVTVDSSGEVIARSVHTANKLVQSLSGGVCLDMVAIPSGVFSMGSHSLLSFEDERPMHSVSVPPLYVGQYPVTQEQWQAVMGSLPRCRTVGARRPVDRVSWNDATAFCKRLSQQTGRRYRLLSEAEWEYACRAGTSTPFYFGETITTDLANYNGEYVFKSEAKGVYRHASTDVCSFPPNAFGLYDMHGGVWEWCQDSWHDDYVGAPVDGSVWQSPRGEWRVMRGGCWHDPPALSRSAARLRQAATDGEDLFGFRVALTSLEHTEVSPRGAGSVQSRLWVALRRLAGRHAGDE